MCLSCKDYAKLHPWQADTDSAEHYKIFQTLKGYNIGVYTKQEAKEKLGTINMDDIGEYKDSIKNQIDSIMEPVSEERPKRTRRRRSNISMNDSEI